MPPRRKSPANILAGKHASICVKRGALSIDMENIPAKEALIVADMLLSGVHKLMARHPESDEPTTLEQVGEYSGLDVPHEGDDEVPPETRKKKLGF